MYLAAKLKLVTPHRIAQVFIDLSQFCDHQSLRESLRRCWPVARKGNGIAADRAGGARKQEEAWSNRLSAIRLTAIQPV